MLEEWDPQLRGLQGKKTIREMSDNHPIITGILFAIEMMCRQVGYSMEPGSDDAQGEKAATFVDDSLHDMTDTFEDKVGEIMSGVLPYGWQLHETNFKKRDGVNSQFSDGKVGWDDWQIRGQETLRRWEFNPKNQKLLGMHQIGPPDWEEHFIPMSKALLFRTTAKKGNPEGKSILRGAYVSFKFQKQIQLIESIGIERDLAGLPYAKIPASIINSTSLDDMATYDAWKQVITNLRRNEQDGLVYASDTDEKGNPLYEVGLMTTGGTRQYDSDQIISRYDQRIAISMLAGFILLGMDGVGSNALGLSMADLFTTALSAFLGSMVEVINNSAIPRLLALNGFPPEDPPKLVHGRIGREDKVALAQSLSALSVANQRGAGIELDGRMDGPLAKALMEILGLPEPPDPKEIGYINPADKAAEAAMELAKAKPAPVIAQPGAKGDQQGNPQATQTPTNTEKPKPSVPTPKKAAETNGHDKRYVPPEVKAAEDEYATALDGFFADLRRK